MTKKETSSTGKWIKFGLTTLVVLIIDIILLTYKSAEMPGSNWSKLISQTIILIIGIVFILSIRRLIKRKKNTNRISDSVPSQMTSLGVLGTFAGIFIGLYNFDVHNLNQSVPLLLEGMKVAFSTSIAGLVSSIGLKYSQTIIISIIQQESPNEAIDQDNLIFMSPQLENSLSNLDISIRELTREIQYMNDINYETKMKQKYGDKYEEKMEEEKKQRLKEFEDLINMFKKDYPNFGKGII